MNGSRTTLLAGLALAGALLIGGSAGYYLGRHSLDKRRGPPVPGARQMTLLGVNRTTLADSLQLTEAQRLLVDSLLTSASDQADTLITRLTSDVRALTRETRRLVRASLMIEQQARFDSLMSRAPQLLPRTPVPPREQRAPNP